MGLRDHFVYVAFISGDIAVITLPFSATYSNLENHPRLIRARQAKPVPKIQLDPKTGLPTVDGQKYRPRSSKGKQISIIEEEEESGEYDTRKRSLACYHRILTRHHSGTRHNRSVKGRVEGREENPQASCEGRKAAASRREEGDERAVLVRDQAGGEAVV